jgi:hypothetical protein
MTDQKPSNGEQSNKLEAKKKKPSTAYRKLRRKFAQTKLRAAMVWIRHRNFFPADVFFAAYPRSGTTWTRFVLFEMLSGMPAGFKVTNQLMPGVSLLHKKALRLLPEGGRLIATHEYYRKEYRRAIYMVRDGRDVLLSEYAFLKALDFFKGDQDEFVEHFLFTCVSAFGPWHRHIDSWMDSPIANTENMMLVRFENLRKDPVLGFAKMAEFLGVDVDLEKIKLAVANNSIQQMRAKEDNEPVPASVKGRFVRDGAVRGWVSRLTPAQVCLIEKHAGNALMRLGYALSSHSKAEAVPNPFSPDRIRDTA